LIEKLRRLRERRRADIVANGHVPKPLVLDSDLFEGLPGRCAIHERNRGTD
jgi:hypothetical protein